MSQLQCNSTAAALINQIYFAADKSHNNRAHTLQEPYSCPPVINIPPCSALISLVPRPHVYELLASYQAVIVWEFGICLFNHGTQHDVFQAKSSLCL